MARTYSEPPKFSVENLIAEGNFVTAIGKIAMKDESGESTDYLYCDVWRFRDCKMAELTAFVIKAWQKLRVHKREEFPPLREDE
jgi:uncharacterized protein